MSNTTDTLTFTPVDFRLGVHKRNRVNTLIKTSTGRTYAIVAISGMIVELCPFCDGSGYRRDVPVQSDDARCWPCQYSGRRTVGGRATRNFATVEELEEYITGQNARRAREEERRAAAERAAAEQAAAQFAAAAEVHGWIAWATYVDNIKEFTAWEREVLTDLATRAANRPLTAKQHALAEKIIAAPEGREAEAAERSAAGPVPTGRVVITGTIASAKVRESMYGVTIKIIIVLDNGSRVWGTLPKTIITALEKANGGFLTEDEVVDMVKDRTVTLTATVARSDDDESFGFFSRPTKGVLA